MTTTPSFHANSDSFANFVPGSVPGSVGQERAGGSAGGLPDGADAELVQETKNQIRALVQEISQLARTEISEDAFYDEFLRRVVTAMACVGGAIWIPESKGLRLLNQINLARTELADDPAAQARHEQLLLQTLRSERPAIVPPHTGAAGDAGGNPTSCLLVLGFFHLDDRRQGLVEIFQRAGGGPATQRGYLRFVVQMCDLASDFFKNRRLRQYGDREALWHDLEQFLRETHRYLDPRAVSFAIANEGRRLVQCDRICVAVCRRGRPQILAVSGVESVERKSLEIVQLEQLTSRVIAARQPFWMLPQAAPAAPQIEEALHAYLDQSHATAVAVVPLLAAAPPSQSSESAGSAAAAREVIGAVIFEQLRQTSFTAGMVERAQVVAQHSETALGNALCHSQLFLLPVWRWLGGIWTSLRRRVPLVALAQLCAAVVVAGLWLWPGEFRIAAPGKLRPALRAEVFAQLDGAVTEVLAQHAELVRAGQPLLQLRSTELEVAQAEVLGLRNRTLEQIDAKEQLLLNNSRLDPVVQDEIAGDLYELKQTLVSAEQRLLLLREKAGHLQVVSPMDGQVVTWQVDHLLLRRPVTRGQALLSVVDPQGPWELELHVPERRLGHVLAAAQERREPLTVTFQLTALPGQQFQGEVVEIQRVAELRGEAGNTVAVRVAIDKTRLPHLHNDASVDGQIVCGRRALGYVLFHDVLETLQTCWLYWF